MSTHKKQGKTKTVKKTILSYLLVLMSESTAHEIIFCVVSAFYYTNCYSLYTDHYNFVASSQTIYKYLQWISNILKRVFENTLIFLFIFFFSYFILTYIKYSHICYILMFILKHLTINVLYNWLRRIKMILIVLVDVRRITVKWYLYRVY